jgi:hypothetical protein
MGQVKIYLDDESEALMKAAAKADGVSQSTWVSELIKRKVRSEWPREVTQLAGVWPDFPSAEEIRKSPEKDVRRVKL